jgi:hypothetical protein
MPVWNFEALQKEISSEGIKTEKGTFYPQAVIDRLFDVLARSIPVDQEFYFAKHPDIEQAWKSGEIASAAHHFVEHGFYEGRLPCNVVIDEDDYLQRYPDVAEGLETGLIESATDHWIRFGRFEKRTAYLHQSAS